MAKREVSGVEMVEIDGVLYRADEADKIAAAKERAAAANKSRSASSTKSADKS